jgi:hypothetical protein
MSKKKLQKFCQLTQVIKSYDPVFYNALDDLCLLPLFRPALEGITFLYPVSNKIRKSIITATYSKSPEDAVKLVKALILRKFYSKPDEISNGSNALNQVVNVQNGHWGTFKVKQASDINYFNHRGKISMFLLEGDGDIPISGPQAPRTTSLKYPNRNSSRSISADGDDENESSVVGGGFGCGCMCWPSHRVTLAKKLAKHYMSEKNKKSNVYTKKVCAQLGYLEKHYPEIYNSDKLVAHLGNEEISDSYLLDMITPDEVLCKIWQAFGKDSNGLGAFNEDSYTDSKGQKMTYHERYLQTKQAAISKNGAFRDEASVSAELKRNLEEQKRLLGEVVAVCDIRESLISSYRNKKQLGKDLFIVFTSVMKEMWEHEFDMESFQHYSYMATNVYTCCDDMVNQEFNQFKDATLHGNLLKSDVFKFVPWTNPKVYVDAGYTTGIYPKPIDLKIYSLNNLVASITANKTGGAASILSEFF